MSGNENPLGSLTEPMSRRELLRVLGIAGGAAALTPSLFRTASADAASRVGTRVAAGGQIASLNWGLSTTPRSLDFIHSYDLATPTIMAISLEGLLRFGPDGSLQPALASSWHRPDPLTYVYNLRPGVKFWDGSPLSADDVVYSMSKNLDPKSGSEVASYYASVKSIKATSPSQVTIKLSSPDALFQYTPAFFAGLVVKKSFWEAHLKDIGTPGVLTLGTGPFKITEYVPEQHVTLLRNDLYWGPKPAIQKLVLQFIPEESTRLLAMQSGQLDGAFEVPADQWNQWQGLPHTTVHSAPGLETEFISFDLRTKPFDDLHVRRAIAHSLDKKGLVNAVLHGRGVPSLSIAPPVTWTSLQSSAATSRLYKSLSSYPYNLKLAKAELAKSSVPGGFSATFTYPDSYPEFGKAGSSLAQNLKQIGITLNVKQMPFNQWLATSRRNTPYNMSSGIWYMDYLDPADVLYNFLDSQFAKPNALNGANFKNAQVDRLLAKQKGSGSRSVRAGALAEVTRLAAEQLPYLPLFLPSIGMAINSKYRYRNFGPLYFYQPWAQYISAV